MDTFTFLRASCIDAARLRNRREVMRGLGGLVGLASLGPLLAICAPCSETAELEDWLRRFGADVLGDVAALGRLGATYFADNPHERDRQHLSRVLVGNRTGQIRQSLIDAIARDWREHDVVVVQGWVFARTEARICGVLHLMGGARA